jgi:hypothetical protein
MLDFTVQPIKVVCDEEKGELKHHPVETSEKQLYNSSIPKTTGVGVQRLSGISMESHQPKVSNRFQEGRLDN